ncbi:hypothetical protein M1L60_00770 [Actinoplanes sp. TRM 88003]|uniref:Uncharacterized protein n=1 Tax=Paractinoplanes aksuensis TaxID=2939490 RepID=A0ABT1DE74_9ACTN|nr:hypothetical protein [Actinoplanes aksuensis]MCO8269116.1 hypothetical protein [Actinoplanes aksuensis]
MISDDDIAAMSEDQRRDLIRRLSVAPRRRRWFVALLLACAVLLVPWIGYLAATLPDSHTVHHWRPAWLGFDLLLLALFATTAVLVLRRRPEAPLVGFGLGLLLLCDAGFDLVTTGRDGLAAALASAVLVELPLAALLMIVSVSEVHTDGGRTGRFGPLRRRRGRD